MRYENEIWDMRYEIWEWDMRRRWELDNNIDRDERWEMRDEN